MVAGLAKTLTGWTGTIKTTVSAVDAEVTPRDGEDSVASLILRLVERSQAVLGLTLTVSVSSAGVLTLTSSNSAFDLVATSNTATRTGFTSTYTSTTTYTAAGAHTSGYYPTYGLRTAPTLATTIGEAVGDGSGALYGVRNAAPVELIAYDTHALAYAQESGSTTGVYDVWYDGRGFTRLHVGAWRRRREGGLVGGPQRLEAVATEVRE